MHGNFATAPLHRYLLACCGDGLARVFNPVTGVAISVLSPKRARSSGRAEGEAKGGGGGGDPAGGTSSKNRSASILENMELPCTCAAFRPHAKVRSSTPRKHKLDTNSNAINPFILRRRHQKVPGIRSVPSCVTSMIQSHTPTAAT